MSKKVIIGSLIIVVSLGVLSALYGFRSYMHHHSPEMMLNWKVDALTKELDLTDEQKLRLDELKEVILSKLDNMREDRDDLAEDVIELVEQEELDQNALNNLITERRAKIGEMIPEVVQYVAAFHSTLTAEQKEKLGNLIENHISCSYNPSNN